MTNMQTVETMYMDQLRNLYSAQQQAFRAFPKLSQSAANDNLRNLIEEHLEEIRKHSQRMESIAFGLGTHPSGRFCKAMETLVQEAYDQLEQAPRQTVENRVLLVLEQLRRYTSESYEKVLALAEQLGQERACDLLRVSLDEVRQFGHQLQQLQGQEARGVA